MNLHPLEGHDEARDGVAAALDRGCLPQALLLHGPPGVGKQRFGLWLAQLLLCQESSRAGPCQGCQGCRLALRVEHPDLHWYFPVKKPPSKGSRDRDDEALEDARTSRIAELREEPLQSSHSEEPLGLHLGTVRNLRRRASSRPAMASRQVFLIADAEELVAQDASPEAANALLKLLEEPPEGTWFILTSAEPGRLLPTIRSRTSSLHLPSLPTQVVADFLVRQLDVAPEEARKAARLSSGAIGRAMGFLADGDGDGPLEALRKESFRLLRDALSPQPGHRFSRALQYRPSGARGLRELLMGLEIWLRDLGAAASGAADALLNQEAGDWLARTAREQRIHPARVARGMQAVQDARAQAAGNVNPQLLLSNLLIRLHRILVAT
jgi:DNA polymerase III subunit delta'